MRSHAERGNERGNDKAPKNDKTPRHERPNSQPNNNLDQINSVAKNRTTTKRDRTTNTARRSLTSEPRDEPTATLCRLIALRACGLAKRQTREPRPPSANRIKLRVIRATDFCASETNSRKIKSRDRFNCHVARNESPNAASKARSPDFWPADFCTAFIGAPRVREQKQKPQKSPPKLIPLAIDPLAATRQRSAVRRRAPLARRG
jgi:hypothetical protein